MLWRLMNICSKYGLQYFSLGGDRDMKNLSKIHIREGCSQIPGQQQMEKTKAWNHICSSSELVKDPRGPPSYKLQQK